MILFSLSAAILEIITIELIITLCELIKNYKFIERGKREKKVLKHYFKNYKILYLFFFILKNKIPIVTFIVEILI